MNKQIDLDKVLFHGLGHNELEDRAEDSIKRLGNILKTKAILSRKKQKEILPKHNIDVPLYYLPLKNGDDYICVCKRKSDKKKSKFSDAFNQFVDGGISLIINPKILKELEIRNESFQDGEFQIKDEISVEYIIGIALNLSSSADFIKGEKKRLKKGKDLKNTEIELDYLYKNYKNVRNLLSIYNFDLPIYSIEDGKIILSIDEILDELNLTLGCSI